MQVREPGIPLGATPWAIPQPRQMHRSPSPPSAARHPSRDLLAPRRATLARPAPALATLAKYLEKGAHSIQTIPAVAPKLAPLATPDAWNAGPHWLLTPGTNEAVLRHRLSDPIGWSSLPGLGCQ